mgnify:CR=1 FL=1
MTGPITVDPTALNSAGASVGAEANSVSSAVTTLSGALSGHEAGFGHDAEEQRRSIRRLKAMEDRGARIIAGHDPEQWATMPRAPQPMIGQRA